MLYSKLSYYFTITTTMRYALLSPSSLKTSVELLDNDKTQNENFGQNMGNKAEGILHSVGFNNFN